MKDKTSTPTHQNRYLICLYISIKGSCSQHGYDGKISNSYGLLRTRMKHSLIYLMIDIQKTKPTEARLDFQGSLLRPFL